MGAPLQDITIYYNGERPGDWGFNYIADFYHNSLNGYKPPKTARICIQFDSVKNWDQPIYHGSICLYECIIDEQKYLSLSKEGKYKYILDLLHSTVSEIASIYSWDQTVFDQAYKHIIESDFKFERIYPEKKSKNRKYVGQIILAKTERRSILSVLVTGDGSIKKEVLFEKENHYWYDRIYKLAQHCKWFDNSSFGLYKGEKDCYFSTENNKVVSDFIFSENDLLGD